jgi:hypothetical protein
MSKRAREEAQKTGELPHEFLLRVARGEQIDGYAPTFPERVEAAKASAPYFAPKLTATDVSADLRTTNRSVSELSDEELLAIVGLAGGEPRGG